MSVIPGANGLCPKGLDCCGSGASLECCDEEACQICSGGSCITIPPSGTTSSPCTYDCECIELSCNAGFCA